jgi:exosome complex component RRP46
VLINLQLSDRATIEVVCRPKEGTGGLEERALEQRLAHVLSRVVVSEAHPRTMIRCVLQLIHPDGAGLACAVNAACLALMDAGVPLRSCVAAATVAVSPDGELVLDPTLEEEEAATATFTFAFTNNGEDVGVSNEHIMCHTAGDHTFDELTAACESARRAAAVVLAFFRKSAERRLARAGASA